jgi:hypothetical protein
MASVMNYFDQALKENGFTNGMIPFDPPTVGRVMKRFKELMAMDENKVRDNLVSKFTRLNLGDMPEVQTMPLDLLEAMTDHLQRAQAEGKLDLETGQGIEELQRIVDGYLAQAGG